MIIETEAQVSNVDEASGWKQAGGTFTTLDGEINLIFVRVISGPADLADELQIDLRPVFDLGGTIVEGQAQRQMHRRTLKQLPDVIAVNRDGFRLPAFNVYVRMAPGSQETVTSLGVTVAHGT